MSLQNFSAIMDMIVTICSWLRNFSSMWAGNSENVPLIANPNQPETMNEFEPLVDHVIQLRGGTNPQIDVVFFHGLPKSDEDEDQTYWKTWTKKGKDTTTECWPTTMLPEFCSRERKGGDFLEDDPRVLAVSWSSKLQLPPNEGTAKTDSYILSEILAKSLVIDETVGAGQTRPVILVGHDLGGILIKQLILYLEENSANQDKFRKFLENLGSVFFYCTPHSGSSAISRAASQIKDDKNEMLKSMIVLNRDMARVNHEFRSYRNNKDQQKFETFAMYALHVTNQGYFKGEKVCEETSVRCDIDHVYSIETDHYGVCQPEYPFNNTIKVLGLNIIKVVDNYRVEEKLKELYSRFDDLRESGFRKASVVDDKKLPEASRSSSNSSLD